MSPRLRRRRAYGHRQRAAPAARPPVPGRLPSPSSPPPATGDPDTSPPEGGQGIAQPRYPPLSPVSLKWGLFPSPPQVVTFALQPCGGAFQPMDLFLFVFTTGARTSQPIPRFWCPFPCRGPVIHCRRDIPCGRRRYPARSPRFRATAYPRTSFTGTTTGCWPNGSARPPAASPGPAHPPRAGLRASSPFRFAHITACWARESPNIPSRASRKRIPRHRPCPAARPPPRLILQIKD